MPLIRELADRNETFTAWRRDLHQMPETSFEEKDTSDYIARQLEAMGVEIHRGWAKTGIVAVIRGKKGDSKRAIGLRADIDALDIPEQTNLPYASKRPGKMHACGHDGHTTMLLAAVSRLAETRDFDGTVYAIFQPAEEGGGGGNVMVQEGFFDKFPCEAVFGMHNWPWLKAGQMAICSGAISAATDGFDMTVTGKGGHAAFPHTTVDVVVCASQIVSALQHIVSRTVDPLKSAVVSVTNFNAGTGADNVLPTTAALSGTVRTLDRDLRQRIEPQFREICKSVAAAYGATVDITWHFGYPPTVNTPAETDFARKVAEEVVGAENVHEFTPMMGGEDFAYFLEACKGAYIVLGQGQTDNDPGLHSPYYNFNDAVIPVGASYWVRLAETWLR